MSSNDHSLDSSFHYKSPASTPSILPGPSSSEDSMPQLDRWSPPKVENPVIIPEKDNVQPKGNSTPDVNVTFQLMCKSLPEGTFVPIPAVSITAVSACSTSPPILSSPDQKTRGPSSRKEYFKQEVNSEVIGPFSTAIGLKVRHLAFADSSHDGLKLSNEKLTNGLVFELDNYLRNSSFFEGKPRSHLFRIIAHHFSYKVCSIHCCSLIKLFIISFFFLRGSNMIRPSLRKTLKSEYWNRCWPSVLKCSPAYLDEGIMR